MNKPTVPLESAWSFTIYNRLLTLDSRPIRSHIPPEADDDEESEEGPVTPTAKSPTPPPPSGDTDSEMEPNDDLDDM